MEKLTKERVKEICSKLKLSKRMKIYLKKKKNSKGQTEGNIAEVINEITIN